jgi:hypothetical protein
MQYVREFATLDGADLAADRALTTEILAAHVAHDRQRRLRIRLVHAVAALSAPVELDFAFPGLLSPATARTLFAAWLGLAIWAVVAAATEWQTGATQGRRMRALRGRSGANDRHAPG